jgi:hypothetical protein
MEWFISFWYMWTIIVLGLGIYWYKKSGSNLLLKRSGNNKNTLNKNSPINTQAISNTTTTPNTSSTSTTKTSRWNTIWNIVGIVAVIFVAIILFNLISGFVNWLNKPETSTNIPKKEITLKQKPDIYTPCIIYINKIQDLYTDGTPVYILPPDWKREDAIYYSGHGRLDITVKNGYKNIPPGDWEFWSDSTNTQALIRVFEYQ